MWKCCHGLQCLQVSLAFMLYTENSRLFTDFSCGCSVCVVGYGKLLADERENKVYEHDFT